MSIIHHMIKKLMNRVRGLIEKLIKNIEPSARLLSFGSSCNSFGLRNSGESPVLDIRTCKGRWADGRHGFGRPD